MNKIFDIDDQGFKLKTFRKINFLLNKILSGIEFDFAFSDEKGYNRNLSPSCSEVIFHNINDGSIYLRINLQTLEIDSLQELLIYIKLIESIIYEKVDYLQISREIKLIKLFN